MAGRPFRRRLQRLGRRERQQASKVIQTARRRNPGSVIHVLEGDEPGIVLVTVDGKKVWSSEKGRSGNVYVAGSAVWRGYSSGALKRKQEKQVKKDAKKAKQAASKASIQAFIAAGYPMIQPQQALTLPQGSVFVYVNPDVPHRLSFAVVSANAFNRLTPDGYKGHYVHSSNYSMSIVKSLFTRFPHVLIVTGKGKTPPGKKAWTQAADIVAKVGTGGLPPATQKPAPKPYPWKKGATHSTSGGKAAYTAKIPTQTVNALTTVGYKAIMGDAAVRKRLLSLAAGSVVLILFANGKTLYYLVDQGVVTPIMRNGVGTPMLKLNGKASALVVIEEGFGVPISFKQASALIKKSRDAAGMSKPTGSKYHGGLYTGKSVSKPAFKPGLSPSKTSQFKALVADGYEPFYTKAVGSTLKGLPGGSVVLLWYTSGKKAYFHVDTGTLRQITLKGYRPAIGLDKLQKVNKGVVLHIGDDAGQLSFPMAQEIVEAARGAKFPSTAEQPTLWSSASGEWQPSGAKDWDPMVWGSGAAYTSAAPQYSTGGVLIRKDGKVLLRAPAGGFDGYLWTHAKGRVDKGETDEEAALREVLEETAYVAKIVAKIPDALVPGTSNAYFLMKPIKVDESPEEPGSKPGPRPGKKYPHWETVQVRWFTPEEARKRIEQTTKKPGRERDLAVLDAAVALWTDLKKGA